MIGQGSTFTPEVNGDTIKCDQSISGGYLYPDLCTHVIGLSSGGKT